LKVVMVAELFVTGDREFRIAGAMMLNALDWKLNLVGRLYLCLLAVRLPVGVVASVLDS